MMLIDALRQLKQRCIHYMYVYFPRLLSDKVYLSVMYLYTMGTNVHWDNPQTFNEKLQWLKIYDRNPKYTTMVDKYTVKKYVADIIGEQYIIPTLGVWKRFEDIDFEKLPNRFVLKCTHDSGGLVICRDKSIFDIESAREKIGRCLGRNFYYQSREWPYKNVPPRIIAEKYMEQSDSSELRDYKFFCFNGEVKFLYLSEGMENHETARICYVTLDWTQMNFSRDDYKSFEQLPPRPSKLDEMIQLTKTLSKDIPHVRVDFYEINGKIYFGELTFYSGGGFTMFNPMEADLEIGRMLSLPAHLN